MLYLTIALLYCANPTLFFSCRNNTAAVLFSAMHNHCITFNTLPQRYFTTHCRRYSEHYFAVAFLRITMPLLLPSLLYQHTAPQHHDVASQLTTAPTLWRASPQHDGSMQCRNKATPRFAFASQGITKLCDSVSRQNNTKPVLHVSWLFLCFAVLILANTELRAAPPYDATTIRFSSALYHGGTPRCIALLCPNFTRPYRHCARLIPALPRRYNSMDHIALPLPRNALPNSTTAVLF